MARELLLSSATELSRRIKDREVSARDVLEAHLAHIERTNPQLNAVVATRFRVAREEADLADAQLAAGAPEAERPLHGVPCTIKECFAVPGMPNASGLWRRRHKVASEDEQATAVTRLRDAGAIVMGVTNTSELCLWMESDNGVYGLTRNPYDLRRTVGGSSGGEGAIVGAGASPFGLGSDIGGSIRMPAFFNGVFGHKPSGGLIPGTGQHPAAEGDARRYLGTGPLARRAEDLYPLVKLLAGPDGIDTGCETMPLDDPATIDVRGLKVIHVPDDGGRTPVHRDLRQAQAAVADHLASIGCDVVERRIPELRYGVEAWSACMNEAAETSFLEMLADGGPPWRAIEEVPRYLMRRSRHSLPAVGLAFLENITKRLTRLHATSLHKAVEMKAAVNEAVGDGIMLYPSHPVPAPFHKGALAPPLYWVYTGALNICQMAVTQVPLGLNRRGVPLGVQVCAPRGGDGRTMAVAMELERAFGGWVPPGLASSDNQRAA
jgi:fatty acid amide hydrolase 2